MAALPCHAMAADKAGEVITSYGDVWVSTGLNDNWRRIQPRQALNIGDFIKTGRLSGVSLRMQDESLIRLAQNTQFRVESIQITSFWRKATALVKDLNQGLTSGFRLISGQLWGRNNNIEVDTQIFTLPATFGIRGTEYSIQVDQDSTTVTIHEGSVAAKNEHGETIIHSGESANIEIGSAPQKTPAKKAENVVQWTLRIPNLINFRHYLKIALQNKNLGVEVYEAYQSSLYAKASDLVTSELQRQPDNLDLKLLQAWISIKSGDLSNTYPSLLQLSEQHPEHVPTQEITALAALLKGDKQKTQSILKSIDNKLLSDDGWVIKGYSLQARYNLDGARQAYLKALQINPQNLAAKIQLATIYLASDQTELAKSQVNLALQQQPDYLPALNLKGFLQLAQNETSSAISIWQAALDSNNADAETHFGLSLAKMRTGQVEEAMQHIATAVLLDPQRSMYLSYWGKMLHQVGRHEKALTVLDSAIRLDNQDPTPGLYKAIILRDLNRPGEAVQHLQLASQLNENRGVYRSRSLLDKDLAVQNVDLSRLYSQLGLPNWAHKKAMHSIKSDFSNASAHLLNAGAYANQPDRSYVLANEVLLTRMLQPANSNTFSSFNGYTSLFEAPDNEYDLSFGAGNHDLQSASLVGSGAAPDKQLAWGFAALHEESDGWRDTNGEKFDNLSFMAKWQPSLKNNFLFSLSATDVEQLDDRLPRFEFDAPADPQARFELNSLQLELGLHHRLTHEHELLAYLTHLDADGMERDNVIDNVNTSPTNGALLGTQERIIDSDFERPHSMLQIQGIKKFQSHQLIYGLLSLRGQFEARTNSDFGEFDSTHTLTDPLSALDSQTNFDLDISLLSFYLQDSLQLSPSLQLDIAAYIEQLDNANAVTGGEWEQNEATGRLGVIWKMNTQHTFRLATFEYLLPLAIARIDPSDIAGVPIFKNTNEGSLVKESDLVWDYEWNTGLLSTTLFKLQTSFTSATPDNNGVQVETTRRGEKDGVIINLNQLLNVKTGLNIEFTHFDLQDELLAVTNRTETAISVGATYVHGNGLTLSAAQIMRDLDFDSTRQDETINVTNLELEYEFPGKEHYLLLQINNLTDEKFNWVTDEFSTTGIAPERLIKLQYRLSF